MNRPLRRTQTQKQDLLAILFVDRTPGGNLISALCETEIKLQEVTKRKIKRVENWLPIENPYMKSEPLGWGPMLGQ